MAETADEFLELLARDKLVSDKILEKLRQQIEIERQRPEQPPPKPGTAVTLQSALKPAPQADDEPSSEESN